MFRRSLACYQHLSVDWVVRDACRARRVDVSRRGKPKGLIIKEIASGDGSVAERGKRVTIHYRGFLSRGEQFRSSREDGEPISFVLGKREVIAGLEYGVEGMRVGGCRELTVSPHLAYRDREVPGIPPNGLLRFEVELLEVQEPENVVKG